MKELRNDAFSWYAARVPPFCRKSLWLKREFLNKWHRHIMWNEGYYL